MLQRRQMRYWWKQLAGGYYKMHATIEPNMSDSLTVGPEKRNTLRKAVQCAECAGITEY